MQMSAEKKPCKGGNIFYKERWVLMDKPFNDPFKIFQNKTFICTQTDNIVLCTLKVRADNQHAKSACAPPNQYKAMLVTK